MNQTKHTPGPWRWHGQVYSQQEAANILIESQRREGQQDRSVTFVTMDGYYDAMARGKDWKEAAANARLIAAAPELLRELLLADRIIGALLNALPHEPGQKTRTQVYRQLCGLHDGEGVVRSEERRAAIAKAEGRA